MKYQLILPLLACVIWASSKKNDDQNESFQSLSNFTTRSNIDTNKSESSEVEMSNERISQEMRSNQESNATTPRSRRSQRSNGGGRKTKPENTVKKQKKSNNTLYWSKYWEKQNAEQEKERKTRLEAEEEDAKTKEEKAKKDAKAAVEDNEAKAKELLKELGLDAGLDEDGKFISKTFFFHHYDATPTQAHIFGSVFTNLANWNSKKEKKQETLKIENVVGMKYAAGKTTEDGDFDEVVIVVLSYPEGNRKLPGKFEEFIVDVKNKTVEHNYINNQFGGDNLKVDKQLYIKHIGGNAHYKNPDYDEAPKLTYMKEQEKQTREKFEASEDAAKLKTNFAIGGVMYGGFYHHANYSLKKN